MWSRYFKKNDNSPQTKKDREAANAKAISKALTPEYLGALKKLARETSYLQLKALIEPIEAACNTSEHNSSMTDRSVIHTAQKLIGILNDIARPPRFSMEVSTDAREYTQYDTKDEFGRTQADIRAQADDLANTLRPHVPSPKLIGRLDGNDY